MFGFTGSHKYLEPGISEIQLYFDILPSDYGTLPSDLAFEPRLSHIIIYWWINIRFS